MYTICYGFLDFANYCISGALKHSQNYRMSATQYVYFAYTQNPMTI